MPSSHPPSLRTLVSRFLTEYQLQGARLVLALSGGPDSCALVHVLTRLQHTFQLHLVGCGVDHGLRPEASAELKIAEDLCNEAQIPWVVKELKVARGGNLQERARLARYQALEEVAAAHQASWIATGHHNLDRAETVLLRLLRGTGLRGLAVLPGVSLRCGGIGRLRPLIETNPTQIVTYLQRHQVRYAVDPSNVDPRFLRVRVRNELLPLLSELNPGIVRHLCALAQEAAEAGPALGDDSEGEFFDLSRSQRQALALAIQKRQRNFSLRLKNGRCLELDANFLPIVRTVR